MALGEAGLMSVIAWFQQLARSSLEYVPVNGIIGISERTESCWKKVLDTAGVVRDAW